MKLLLAGAHCIVLSYYIFIYFFSILLSHFAIFTCLLKVTARINVKIG